MEKVLQPWIWKNFASLSPWQQSRSCPSTASLFSVRRWFHCIWRLSSRWPLPSPGVIVLMSGSTLCSTTHTHMNQVATKCMFLPMLTCKGTILLSKHVWQQAQAQTRFYFYFWRQQREYCETFFLISHEDEAAQSLDVFAAAQMLLIHQSDVILQAALCLWCSSYLSGLYAIDATTRYSAECLYCVDRWILSIYDGRGQRGGTERKRGNYIPVCCFSTTDSAVDLSIHSTVRLLIFQSHGSYTCVSWINDQSRATRRCSLPAAG